MSLGPFGSKFRVKRVKDRNYGIRSIDREVHSEEVDILPLL